ncbi:MAG: hypothetical protein WBZ33_16285 [Thermoactinomyces sp.]
MGNAGQGDNYTLVFDGTRRGNVVTGNWATVPRGTTTSNGTARFTVRFNATDGAVVFDVTNQTGGFPATQLVSSGPGGVRRPVGRKKAVGRKKSGWKKTGRKKNSQKVIIIE